MDISSEITNRLFDLGFLIHPLRYGEKVPATKNGFKDAVKTREAFLKLVNSSIRSEKKLFNVGIATGRVSNCFALDIDPRNNGDKTLIELFKNNNCTGFNTLTFLTGGGGCHFIHRYPIGSNLEFHKTIGEGIDIKSDGGYIVAPGSTHPNGNKYSIQEPMQEISEAPEWLIKLVLKNSIEPGTNTNLTNSKLILEAGAITKGSRNNGTFSFINSLLDRGLPRDNLRLAAHNFNIQFNTPPMSSAEVDTIVNSALKRSATKVQIEEPVFNTPFYGLAGEFVNQVLPETESSGIGLYFQFLIVFGIMCGKNAHITIGATKHYPNEFLLLVGKSSKSRKGSSMDVISHIFKNRDPEFFENDVKRNITSGEGVVEMVKDDTPAAAVKTKKIKEVKNVIF